MSDRTAQQSVFYDAARFGLMFVYYVAVLVGGIANNIAHVIVCLIGILICMGYYTAASIFLNGVANNIDAVKSRFHYGAANVLDYASWVVVIVSFCLTVVSRLPNAT